MGLQRGFYRREGRMFDLDPLWHTFLDEISMHDGFGGSGVEAKGALATGLRQAQLFEA